MTSRFGFTGEYYAQETGMWHLRARDLHPSLGRFLSADPVQPNAPGTQGYNRYAYVANNPTTWVDPSGYSVEPLAADLALMGMMFAMGRGLSSVLQCALSEECRGLKALMRKLGSKGANYITWTVEELQNVLFSTYPHQPTPVDPGMLVLSIGLSNTPIIGDLYDLYTGVTGYDPVTKQYLAGWERLANIAGAIPIFGVSGANIRQGAHAAESLIDSGDELGQLIGAAGKSCSINSFSEETPVATDEGAVPIGEIDVGDRVLAWHEETDVTGYYTVTAVWAHEDPVTIQLVVNGEVVETTPEHPFYEIESAPWVAAGTTQGRWTPAGELKAGDQIRQADGATGVVQTIVFEATPQVMYNLTVAEAHTFFVGDGEWLVHNCRLNVADIRFSQAKYSVTGGIDGSTGRYSVDANIAWLVANPDLDLPWGGPIHVFVKEPDMDAWGPLTYKGFVGNPINLANGFIYTLDNRRLVAYLEAKRDTIPVVWAEIEEIMRKRYEFDTPNWGISIERRD